jgi:hypothetical protein
MATAAKTVADKVEDAIHTGIDKVGASLLSSIHNEASLCNAYPLDTVTWGGTVCVTVNQGSLGCISQ